MPLKALTLSALLKETPFLDPLRDFLVAAGVEEVEEPMAGIVEEEEEPSLDPADCLDVGNAAKLLKSGIV